ncbi:hypothetical protein YCF20 [Stanieria sp. NIES-3757]|nr:hypothetical protein YCF20 [Stanieria sp. NIES-3757]
MQRTRLNSLVDVAGARIELLFTNPWRRIALSVISILFGFFMGSAIATTAGQDASWDVVGAALILIFTELLSNFVYSRPSRNRTETNLRRPLLIDVVNLFKIGLIYSLFLEAFKLGS